MANLDTLALAVWAFDERVLNVTAASMIRGTSIFHVEVIEDGKTRLTLDRPGSALKAEYSWEIPLLRPNSPERIGTLRLAENYDEDRAQVARRAGLLVITELTKIAATSVLISLVAYFLITRSLARARAQGSRWGFRGTVAVNRPLRRDARRHRRA